MQTFLEQALKETAQGEEASRIIRSCVHCGFCTAVCPTYQLTGDDLDSPRGRIYLMKSLVEGRPAGRRTQFHLDRCLVCRACETACPSGVEYGKLLTIGQRILSRRVRRSFGARMLRLMVKTILPHRNRFAWCVRAGRLLRPLLPGAMRTRLPPRWRLKKNTTPVTLRNHDARVILFAGCVQDALAPEINRAARRILDSVNLTAVSVNGEGCCGAIHYHMADHDRAIEFMCRNIDRWWPCIEAGAQAIVFTASGCGLMIKEYGQALKDVPEYADKARRVAAIAKDISELFDPRTAGKLAAMLKKTEAKVVYQCPCTLQHGLKQPGGTRQLLIDLGINLVQGDSSGMCCGSAGAYSLFEPAFSTRLQRKKIAALMQHAPDLIATSNIGCLHHLQQVSRVPVQHWVEVAAALLPVSQNRAADA